MSNNNNGSFWFSAGPEGVGGGLDGASPQAMDKALMVLVTAVASVLMAASAASGKWVYDRLRD